MMASIGLVVGTPKLKIRIHDRLFNANIPSHTGIELHLDGGLHSNRIKNQKSNGSAI
jgi:hypothetical protein